MNNITTLKPKEGVTLLAIVVDKFGKPYYINDLGVQGKYFCYYENKSQKDIRIDDEYSMLGTVEYNHHLNFNGENFLLIQPVTYHEYTPSYIEWVENEFKDFLNEGRWFGTCDAKSEYYSMESLLKSNNINLQQLDRENKKLVILKKK